MYEVVYLIFRVDLKPVLFSILSLIVLFGSASGWMMKLDYALNQEFYEQHCINKDKPELQCHGKCQLKDKTEKKTEGLQLYKILYDFNFISANQKQALLTQGISYSIINIWKTVDQLVLKGFVSIPNPPPDFRF